LRACLVDSYCADIGFAIMPLLELMDTTRPRRAFSIIGNRACVKMSGARTFVSYCLSNSARLASSMGPAAYVALYEDVNVREVANESLGQFEWTGIGGQIT
jgi:hypothetical protein